MLGGCTSPGSSRGHGARRVSRDDSSAFPTIASGERSSSRCWTGFPSFATTPACGGWSARSSRFSRRNRRPVVVTGRPPRHLVQSREISLAVGVARQDGEMGEAIGDHRHGKGRGERELEGVRRAPSAPRWASSRTTVSACRPVSRGISGSGCAASCLMRPTLSRSRRADVLGLRWSDVDLVAGVASVSQGRVALDRGDTTDETKSEARQRSVPVEAMHPGTVAALRALSARQAAERLRPGARTSTRGSWSSTRSGSRCGRSGTRTGSGRWARRRGFRRSRCTRCGTRWRSGCTVRG